MLQQYTVVECGASCTFCRALCTDKSMIACCQKSVDRLHFLVINTDKHEQLLQLNKLVTKVKKNKQFFFKSSFSKVLL